MQFVPKNISHLSSVEQFASCTFANKDFTNNLKLYTSG